ncbi:c-type cytochrome [Microbulbifer yueqingensis]|uniref:Cytochrome c5 n=1 Tax=Microbulbifer yueqingensis TaxID=658219 RepID=A0A1G8UPI0_9GAMM|nr:c-type cytochrome [Microbulbifer yueqingensis]SDJ55691.1 Cytochrome c5 [Microbulbifer yueqingensis]
MKASLTTLAAILLLTACAAEREPRGETPETTAAETAAPETGIAATEQVDGKLHETYLRSCHSCHGPGVTGAPRTGDVAAWEPRAAKGLEVLVDNAMNGYKAMPPKGLCFDCTEEEFAGLIRYMAGAALPDETPVTTGGD